jgi:3-oxoacyl-[acyl-carrier protein] reductase
MDQQVALVTEAKEFAGPAAVAGLMQGGFRVICHDRSFGDGAARDAFAAANPGLGVTLEQEPEKLVESVIAEHGAIDVLVSNDWFPVGAASIEDSPLDEYRAMLEALMVRPFRLLKSIVPQFKRRRGGRIILVTSAGALRPSAGTAMYSSARAGATAIADSLARELAPFEVQVNAIAPFFLYSTTYFPGPRWENWEQDPELRQVVEREVPLKRFGRPQEMADLIAFLASGKAAYLTGQTIVFGGGWS